MTDCRLRELSKADHSKIFVSRYRIYHRTGRLQHTYGYTIMHGNGDTCENRSSAGCMSEVKMVSKIMMKKFGATEIVKTWRTKAQVVFDHEKYKSEKEGC